MAIKPASQIAGLIQKGFSRDQARMIVLMKQAAGLLFQAFPEAFVLFGGAALVLFYDSVRHSNDLDLLSNNTDLPSSEAIIECLKGGLQPVIEALGIGALQYRVKNGSQPELKIFVADSAGLSLFQIDFTRFGSVIASEVEDHPIELEGDVLSHVKAVSRDFLLLQKAEAFLQRRIIKARDAYDIFLLFEVGADLSSKLHAHLEDSLHAEFDADAIKTRIGQLTGKLCQRELQPLLPPKVYGPLEKANFKPLHKALEKLYAHWLP